MRRINQQGSALIVSLIMLTSVTFLAIISLQSSTTQIRIVNNLQIKEDIFHTSKRELGSQYDAYKNSMDKIQELSEAMAGSAILASDGSPSPQPKLLDPIVDTSGGYYVQTTQVRYSSIVPVNLNYSFAKDSSVGNISSMPFELLSETADSSDRFRSSQRLGFKYNVPSAGR